MPRFSNFQYVQYRNFSIYNFKENKKNIYKSRGFYYFNTNAQDTIFIVFFLI